MIGGELSCKTNRAVIFAIAVTKDSSQLEVATPTHHGASEQLSLTCRIWYDVGNCDTVSFQLWDCYGLTSFVEFFKDNVLNEIFENKFPSKNPLYGILKIEHF